MSSTSHVRMSSLIFATRTSPRQDHPPQDLGGWGAGRSCLMTSPFTRDPEFFFYLRQMHLQIIVCGKMVSVFCFIFFGSHFAENDVGLAKMRLYSTFIVHYVDTGLVIKIGSNVSNLRITKYFVCTG